MKFISRFLIILFLFCIALASNANSFDFSNPAVKHTNTISITKYNEIDYNKDRHHTIISNLNCNNSNYINNKRNDNNVNNSIGNITNDNNKQFENLISYIYIQSYLQTKTKINQSSVFSEILPNAP